MQILDFWILRKGEAAWKVAPAVGDPISEHPDNKKCLFCGDGHEIGAAIAFCWRKPGAEICTAGICVDCAGRVDEKLAEMAQQGGVPGSRRAPDITELCDELEAEGLARRGRSGDRIKGAPNDSQGAGTSRWPRSRSIKRRR